MRSLLRKTDRFVAAVAILVVMTVGQPVAFSQETDPKPPPSEGSEGPQTSDPQEPPTAGPRRERTIDRPKPKEKAQRVYLERIVAQPMSHEGAPWLIRPNREDEESVLEASEQLGLKSGMTVCDLGCGNGFWTLPMAKAVGEQGKVFAVDIQRQMLQMLRVRSMKERITNIEPVLGTISNPNLPIEKIDLILLVDVYHEFSHPQTMLWHMRNSLRDSGVVALLEYREEDPTVPIKPLHKMSKRQIMKEYTANGFKLVREYNQLPWQHLMFFARDDSSLPEIDPKPSSQVLLDLQRSNVSPE